MVSDKSEARCSQIFILWKDKKSDFFFCQKKETRIIFKG